jgi:Ser/Thr protein kinase RdoA (MazF antagonist)
MTSAQPPPAAGVRIPWSELPERVRAAIESWLGSPVVSALSQPGGFSPGLAARLQAASGRRVFAKAAGPLPNRFAASLHRREATVAAMLPADAPTPRLLWSYDEGDGGWMVLVFEDIAGRQPAQPWQQTELDRVLATMEMLARRLTPAPLAAGQAATWFAVNGDGWRRLQEEQPPALDDWSARHLGALADLEERTPPLVAGDTLLHFDIRADNLLLTPERVVVVDWPHARIGAAWVDLVLFAPSVAMQGGPLPEELLGRYSAAWTADPEAITATAAAVAGFFTWHALQPPSPGLPTLRAFQAAQAAAARTWLAQRTGWS